MPPSDRLKLLNGWTNRPVGVSQRDPLRLYAGVNLTTPPDPARLSDFRVYCVADLLRRVLLREGRQVQLVSQLAQADLVVSAEPPPVGRGILVRVAAPVGDSLPGIEPNEARYLMYSMPPGGTLQWSSGALAGAKAALSRLKDYAGRLKPGSGAKQAEPEGVSLWRGRFYEQLYDDLNTPRALAILWTMLQSELAGPAKYGLLSEFGGVLGLEGVLGLPPGAPVVPSNGQAPAVPRDWQKKPKMTPVSGVEGNPTRPAPKARPGSPPPPEPTEERRRIIQSRDVRSHLNEPDRFDFTVSLIAYHNLPRLRTTVESLVHYTTRSLRSVEIIVVEMSGDEAAADYLDVKAAQVANFRVVYARQNLGEAAARNVAFRQGRGHYLLLLDAGIGLRADIFETLWPLLSVQPHPALYGAYALTLERPDGRLEGFGPATPLPTTLVAPVPVEALDGTVLCLPRQAVETVGFMDEHFRVPYALDLDYSFGFKDKGLAVQVLPGLPDLLDRPDPARPTYDLTPDQQARQQQKNWQLFLRSWEEE